MSEIVQRFRVTCCLTIGIGFYIVSLYGGPLFLWGVESGRVSVD